MVFDLLEESEVAWRSDSLVSGGHYFGWKEGFLMFPGMITG